MKKRLEHIKTHPAGLAVCIICGLVYIGLLYWANTGWSGYTITNTTGIEYETARVIGVGQDNTVTDDSLEGFKRGDRELELEITSGRYKGDRVTVTNYLSATYNVDVTTGDSVAVRIDTNGEDQYQVSVYNYNRSTWLLLFIGIFALALVAIGGFQGFRAFLGLIFTFVSIIYLLVPLTLRGYPSVLLTVLLVAITTVVSLYLLGGWTPKTKGAMLGCISGVCCAALFGAVAIALVKITAYQMDEAESLILLQNEHGLKIRGLFLSSVLLASLGAVMDVAMSIASSMEELKLKRPDLKGRELFQSGIKVGRDASGTMANTLVLAIAGSAFNMMILIYSYHVSFIQLMNTDFVAIELIRGIAGSLGIIMAIPFGAFFTAMLLCRQPES